MPAKQRPKILVIDDNPTTVRLLEKWLKVDGYDVISTLKGAEGLQRAKGEKPNLILLDRVIPNVSGPEVARQLRADPLTQHIPIIFITVTVSKDRDKKNEEIEIEGQMERVFGKPLHNRKLLSVIRKTINKQMNT